MVYKNLGNEGVLMAYSPIGGALAPTPEKRVFSPSSGHRPKQGSPIQTTIFKNLKTTNDVKIISK